MATNMDKLYGSRWRKARKRFLWDKRHEAAARGGLTLHEIVKLVVGVHETDRGYDPRNHVGRCAYDGHFSKQG